MQQPTRIEKGKNLSVFTKCRNAAAQNGGSNSNWNTSGHGESNTQLKSVLDSATKYFTQATDAATYGGHEVPSYGGSTAKRPTGGNGGRPGGNRHSIK